MTELITNQVPHQAVVLAAKNFYLRKGFEIVKSDVNFDVVAWEPEEKSLHFANVYQVDEWPEGTEISRKEFENEMASFLIENVEEVDSLGLDFRIVYDECHMKVVNFERAILRWHSDCFNNGSDIEGEN